MATCTLTSGSNYTCSGTDTTWQGVAALDAAVTTAPGYSNTTSLQIFGASFTDTNASTLSSSYDALQVTSDSYYSTNGFTLTANSKINGSVGIRAFLDYTGNMTMNLSGSITASDTGIWVYSPAQASDSVIINMASNSTIVSSSKGIYAHMGYGNGIIINTAGKINADGTAIYADAMYSADINIKNSGDITAGTGIYANAQLSGTSTIDIENTGNIITTSTGITSTGGATETIINSGTITSGYNGIFFDTSGVILTVLNNGKITAENEGIGALHIDNSQITVTNNGDITSTSGNGIQFMNNTEGVSVINTGNITATTSGKYAIVTSWQSTVGSADTILQKSGAITGGIFLGGGDDTLTATGGTLVGNTEMGAGNDTMTLSGTADVTGAPQLDGGVADVSTTGVETDTLNIENITLRGFTAASDDSTGNLTETNNTNLTQWEVINVSNSGTLKLSGDLFAESNVGTLNIVDSTSTLD